MRGTVLDSEFGSRMRDLKQDAEIGLNSHEPTSRFYKIDEDFQNNYDKIKDSEIRFVGHSLAGNIIEHFAEKYKDINAVTFNPGRFRIDNPYDKMRYLTGLELIELYITQSLMVMSDDDGFYHEMKGNKQKNLKNLTENSTENDWLNNGKSNAKIHNKFSQVSNKFYDLGFENHSIKNHEQRVIEAFLSNNPRIAKQWNIISKINNQLSENYSSDLHEKISHIKICNDLIKQKINYDNNKDELKETLINIKIQLMKKN